MFTIRMFHLKILFLPVADPELNPEEIFWSKIERGIAKTNTTFRLSHVEGITINTDALMTAEGFSRYVEHVKTQEEKFKFLSKNV